MVQEIVNELESREEPPEVQVQAPALSQEERALLEEMIKAGVIYGRKKSKTNPKMAHSIFATRRGIEIFDIIQTLRLVEKTVIFLKEVRAKNLPVLVVGTQPAAKDLVKNFSAKLGFSFVTERWLGGTLTNFKVISQRVQYYLKMKADLASGQLDKYPKKERLKINELVQKMTKNFSGIEQLVRLPETVLVINPAEHQTVVREANRLHIPVVSIINSDGNPDQVQYPIPANSNARSSIAWILTYVEKKLLETPAPPMAESEVNLASPPQPGLKTDQAA